MDDVTISAVVAEIAPLLTGRSPGKIFQLTTQSLVIDFGLRQHGYLFISVEPANPRLYLIKRRVRDLEKASVPLTQFGLSLRKATAQTSVTSFEKLPNDRVVSLSCEGLNELGQSIQRTFVAQLTGRSANLFILDETGVITARLRETRGAGQTIGEKYHSPGGSAHQPAAQPSVATESVKSSKSVSETVDEHYAAAEAQRGFDSQVAAARAQLKKEISRRNKLLKQLEHDLAEHSDADQHKRIGDLLLANVGTATRSGARLKVIDYFAEGAPEIEIEIDEQSTLPEEAARRFQMYSRSKRARVQIADRIKQVKAELAEWEAKRDQLESSPSAFVSLTSTSETKPHTKSAKSRATRVPGARRYISSDGYEILVGRAARDNDNLTFKVAKPHDLWLHAADYPGSHVIVRNPTRKEVPHRTLIEAAQLAAYFSQASKDPKVDVHSTERKFLSKPKGAAPGLVRMSRFKSLTVTPAENVERLM